MCNVLPRNELDRMLKAGIDHVREHHSQLVEWYVHEINLCHHLAVYLAGQEELVGWHIDIEYNRQDNYKTKKLDELDPEKYGRKTSHVRPDLIIHRRGPDGPNLLVVEAKRNGAEASELELEFDRNKLQLFLEDPHFNYSHAALISFTEDQQVLWAPQFAPL